MTKYSKFFRISANHLFAAMLGASILFMLPSNAEAALEEEINLYFEEMIQGFEEIAKSSSAKSSNLRKSKNFLMKQMKKNQTYYSLMRTNSKGVVINELIRSAGKIKKFRNISSQKSFKTVAKKKRPYFGYLKSRKTGRYYMLWATPYFVKGNKFGGVILAKVDIWDSFHAYSEFTDVHFLITQNSKSLYSHKWARTKKDYIEKSLDIPGVKKLKVRYPTENGEETPAAAASTGDTKNAETAKAVSTPDNSAEVKKAALTDEPAPAAMTEKGDKGFPTWIIGIIIILAVGLGLGILMAMNSKRDQESIL